MTTTSSRMARAGGSAAGFAKVPPRTSDEEPDPERWEGIISAVLLQANEIERGRLLLLDRMRIREGIASSGLMTPGELAFHRRQAAQLEKVAGWREEEARGLRELAAFATECREKA